MKFDRTFFKGFLFPILLVIPFIVVIQLIWPNFFTKTLLNTSLEPHGYCLLWDPGLIYLHLGSDFFIGSSYVVISTTLVFIVFSTRKIVPFQWLFLAFGTFIMACGLTHFIEIYTLWSSVYWLAGAVKAVTAVASITTAIALVKYTPQALKWVVIVRQSETQNLKLEAVNATLKTEIAQRKLTDEALRKSEETYRTLARNFPNGVVLMFDHDLRFTVADGAGLPQLGLNRELLEGKTLREGFSQEFWQVEEPFYRAALQGQSNRHEVSMGAFTFLVHTLPIKNEQGNIYGGMAMTQNITETKNASLALVQAKEVAEAAVRTKSDFLANMSHEIRTPLNGVIGMTDLLINSPLTTQQRSYAEIARQSGESLLAIINDILDFSKIEAGKMRFETIDFNLNSVVENVANLLAEQAYSKNLELVYFVEPDVPLNLRGDPLRVSQILINFTANAIKFTFKGEVVIRTSLLSDQGDRVMLRFEVIDSGIGISAQQQEYLFEPFSQADASTTRQFGGTGLGLAISTQLVRRMGGEIGLESVPGVGSTFWATLPFDKLPQTDTAHAPMVSSLEGTRVLVVDNNAVNSTILNKQLGAWKMVSHSVESGQGALEVLHRAAAAGTPFEIAILDMKMPQMDGMELARTIKADPAIAATRLMLLTSLMQSNLGTEARAVGIFTTLSKPVRQSELFDSIISLLAIPLDPAIVNTSKGGSGSGRHSVGNAARSEGTGQPGAIAPVRNYSSPAKGLILVAEDNIVNQIVAAGYLEAWGYEVELVSNGIEALTRLKQQQYAAVLMDCQMPAMDGYTATTEFRRWESETPVHSSTANSGRKPTPVIAMTANALTGEREKCLEAGMDDYITKPIRPEVLKEALERWITVSNSSNNPPQSQTGTPSDAAISSQNGVQFEEEETLDRSVLEELANLQPLPAVGKTLVQNVIGLFNRDSQSRLENLKEAALQNDTATMMAVAHALKGSCLNVGAKKMAHASANLELAARNEKLTANQTQRMVAEIEAEYGRVKLLLEGVI